MRNSAFTLRSLLSPRPLAAALCLALTVCLVSGCLPFSLLREPELPQSVTRQPTSPTPQAVTPSPQPEASAGEDAPAASLPKTEDPRFQRQHAHTDLTYARLRQEQQALNYDYFDVLADDTVQLERFAEKGAAFPVIAKQYETLYGHMAVGNALALTAYIDYLADPADTQLQETYLIYSDLAYGAEHSALKVLSLLASHPDYARPFSGLAGEEAALQLARHGLGDPQAANLSANAGEVALELEELYITRGSMSDEAFEARAAELMLQLVAARNELARYCGYDNYADYAYDRVYGRDYTVQDAQLLCDGVKQHVTPAVVKLYSVYPRLHFPKDMTLSPQQQLAILETGAARLGTVFQEPCAYMVQKGYYCFSDGMVLSEGYTMELPTYGTAFLVTTTDSYLSGLPTLVHEFGHYANSYYNPTGNIFAASNRTDINEIHSTGLEVLMLPCYGANGVLPEDILTDLTVQTLLGLLCDNLMQCCALDEWQRCIYARGEDLTPQELGESFADICAQYGFALSPEEWADYPFYDSPFYEISYAVSGVAALELYVLSREDHPAAVDMYLELLSHGTEEQKVMALTESCGFTPFTQADLLPRLTEVIVSDIRDLK